jgi:hypothetical protein
MLYAAFMTAANAAKRSGTPEGAKLFLEGNQSGGEGQPVVVANSGDWAPLIHHRQREFTDLGCRLNAQVQQWETQARVYRDRLANVEHLVLDPTKELQPLLDEGILEGVKFDGAGTWLKMAPIVVKCEEARYDGRDYPSGTFEIPSAVVHVPVEGPGQLKILDAASGERHEHPHVRMGPEHRGLPCWGETEEIKLRNESRAEDLWFSSPKDFVYFPVGFMSSVYDEGNGSYPPFQHWCRRVDEPQSGA